MIATSEPKPACIPEVSMSAVRQFAFRVAGPRDLLINVAINGTIAWLLYGVRESVPVAGNGSLFDMLVPMTAIETIATTFFGLLNGTVEYRKRTIACGNAGTPLTATSRMRWFGLASFEAGMSGSIAFASILAVRECTAFIATGREISGLISTAGIAVFSGLLAYVAHSRAVLSGARLAHRRF